jgi:hypothetical protein
MFILITVLLLSYVFIVNILWYKIKRYEIVLLVGLILTYIYYRVIINYL